MKPAVVSYIVRIYNYDGKEPERLAGIVEKVGIEKWRKAFRMPDELVNILIGEKQEDNNQIERRQAERMRLKLPVLVKGTNEMGKRFTEKAFLEDLSSSGAYLFLSTPVNTDCRMSMIIDPEQSGLAVRSRIIRLAKGNKKNGIGVVFGPFSGSRFRP